MNGNRAIFQEGWKAVSKHKPDLDLDKDQWELYHLENDFNELNDLAAIESDRLQRLSELWWSEAEKHGFLPLEKRSMKTVFASRSSKHKNSEPVKRVFYRSDFGLPVKKAPDLRNKPFEISAEVHRTHQSEEGVIVAVGGNSSGYTFYVQNNRLVFANNVDGIQHQMIISDEELPIGSNILRIKFVKTGKNEGVGKLFVNDRRIGTGKLTEIKMLGFSFGLFNIGQNESSPVVPAYQAPFRFSGDLKKVVYLVSTPELDIEAATELEMATE
jgi:arylsulfatase